MKGQGPCQDNLRFKYLFLAWELGHIAQHGLCIYIAKLAVELSYNIGFTHNVYNWQLILKEKVFHLQSCKNFALDNSLNLVFAYVSKQ